MSLIIVHLRWDDVGPERYARLVRDLPDGDQRPDGCLLRRHRLQGRAVLATEVWIDEQHAGAFLDGLPELLGASGMGEPQRVVFAVPDCFAAGYGVYPARARRTTTAAPVIPAARTSEEPPLPAATPDREQLAPSG